MRITDEDREHAASYGFDLDDLDQLVAWTKRFPARHAVNVGGVSGDYNIDPFSKRVLVTDEQDRRIFAMAGRDVVQTGELDIVAEVIEAKAAENRPLEASRPMFGSGTTSRFITTLGSSVWTMSRPAPAGLAYFDPNAIGPVAFDLRQLSPADIKTLAISETLEPGTYATVLGAPPRSPPAGSLVWEDWRAHVPRVGSKDNLSNFTKEWHCACGELVMAISEASLLAMPRDILEGEIPAQHAHHVRMHRLQHTFAGRAAEPAEVSLSEWWYRHVRAVMVDHYIDAWKLADAVLVVVDYPALNEALIEEAARISPYDPTAAGLIVDCDDPYELGRFTSGLRGASMPKMCRDRSDFDLLADGEVARAYCPITRKLVSFEEIL